MKLIPIENGLKVPEEFVFLIGTKNGEIYNY